MVGFEKSLFFPTYGQHPLWLGGIVECLPVARSPELSRCPRMPDTEWLSE